MKGRRLPRNAEGKESHMMVGIMIGRKATLVRLAVNWLIVHSRAPVLKVYVPAN